MKYRVGVTYSEIMSFDVEAASPDEARRKGLEAAKAWEGGWNWGEFNVVTVQAMMEAVEEERRSLNDALRRISKNRDSKCSPGCDCSWCIADEALKE